MSHIKLLRPKHWVKNAFLFIPAFFSGDLFNQLLNLDLFLGFLAFSFTASSIYIINDYQDIEADKLHPKKSSRPLASGKVRKVEAIVILIILILSSIALSYALSPKFAFILGVYFVMNLAYSLGLKKIAILDIIIVAIGFVLRVKAGGVICQVPITQWLIVMVFLLALFIAVAKRRDDVLIKSQTGRDMRKASGSYNLIFLNSLQSILSAVIIVSYLMYTLSEDVMKTFETHRIYYTSLFVVAGIMRYLQIALVDNNTGSPTELLYSDRFIQGTLILWILSFYLIIYYPQFGVF